MLLFCSTHGWIDTKNPCNFMSSKKPGDRCGKTINYDRLIGTTYCSKVLRISEKPRSHAMWSAQLRSHIEQCGACDPDKKVMCTTAIDLLNGHTTSGQMGRDAEIAKSVLGWQIETIVPAPETPVFNVVVTPLIRVGNNINSYHARLDGGAYETGYSFEEAIAAIFSTIRMLCAKQKNHTYTVHIIDRTNEDLNE